MPLYAYKCDNCGVQFDKLQKFTDKPIKRCPECGKSKTRRVIQASGIIFKGSGWYKTDSQSASSSTMPSPSSSKKEKKADSSESKTESKAESKTESKTESKAESKTESKSKKSDD